MIDKRHVSNERSPTHPRWATVLVLLAACSGGSASSAHNSKPAADSGTDLADGATSTDDSDASAPTDAALPATHADSGTKLPPPARPLVLKNYVFVTSTLHGADFGGQLGADAICKQRARAAGLPGQYMAWLSTVDIDARDRIPDATGGWVRTDKRPFATSLAALTSGAVLYPPRLDELGNDLVKDSSPVITATGPDGTFFREGSYTDCAGWTSIDTTINYRTGTASGGTYQWTAADGATCTQHGHILCLGIDDAVSIKVAARTGRLAFLSTRVYLPGKGVAAADALCANEATASALSGSFIALLATGAASAVSRLSAGETWVRADGVAIVDHAADLLGGKPLLAPISVQLDGSYHGTVGAWTGAGAPNVVAKGALHCSSWSASTGEGLHGLSGSSGAQAFDFDLLPCTANYLHLYCLER